MARFSQYYIKYKKDFGSHNWEKRQDHLAALFENNDSIIFGSGKPSTEQEANGELYAKRYKHRVYHLKENPKIVVMQFANAIDIPVEIDYTPATAKDEPSCFVIIDNRVNLRTVAIQKRKKAFGNPSQVAKIVGDRISELLYKQHCYSLEILPEYYPEDLFKTWSKVQSNAQSLRFSFPEMEKDEILEKISQLKKENKEYFDDSLMPALIEMALEAKKAQYKQQYTVMPEDKKTALYVDKTSVFMKNLLTFSSAIGEPVEIVTSDAGTFRCFIDTDEDNTDKIVCREFEANQLEHLFTKRNSEGEQLDESAIKTIENNIIEMLGGMKHEVNKDEKEQVA